MRGASRRAFVAGTAAIAACGPSIARASRVPPPDLALSDWTFEKRSPFVHRSIVLAPTHLPAGTRVPVLVLLHGLGEAKEGPESGVYAWLDRYGLGGAYARLRKPPLASILKRKDLTDERAATLNAELAARAFGGMVLVCPFTPNVWSFKSTPGALDALTDFTFGALLDRVARDVPEADMTRIGLDGCSLGGFVGLELLARAGKKDARLVTFGVVQPAIGEGSVDRYARVVAVVKDARPRLGVHVESSKGDPYLRVSRLLAARLTELGVQNDFIAPPGPHDQPFLRDVGTLEMLLFHDRALRA